MGKRGRPKQFDAPDLRVRIDKALEAKLDSLPGESRSQKVRDLIERAAYRQYVEEHGPAYVGGLPVWPRAS